MTSAASADAGLGHDHGLGRNPAGQGRENGTVDVERLEVADVDADDRGLRRDGPFDFLFGVRFHQHVHAELVAECAEVGKLGVGQRRDDQQDQVRAVGTGFPDLVLVHREVLAQQRHVDGGADGVEVREGPAEAALFGEDADDGGAAVGVLPGERRGIGDGGEITLGGAAALDFGDDLELVRGTDDGPPRAAQASRAGAAPAARSFSSARDTRPLAGLHVLPDTGVDVIENSHH